MSSLPIGSALSYTGFSETMTERPELSYSDLTFGKGLTKQP